MFRAVTDTDGIPASAPAGTARMFFSPDLFDSATGKYPKDNPPANITYPLLNGKFQYWSHAASMGLIRLWPTSDTFIDTFGTQTDNVAGVVYSAADKAAPDILQTSDAYRISAHGGRLNDNNVLVGNHEELIFSFTYNSSMLYKGRVLVHMGWNIQSEYWEASHLEGNGGYIWFESLKTLPSFAFYPKVDLTSTKSYGTVTPDLPPLIEFPPTNLRDSHPFGYTDVHNSNQSLLDGTGIQTSALGVFYLDTSFNQNFTLKARVSSEDISTPGLGSAMSAIDLDLIALCIEAWPANLYWPTSDTAGAENTYRADRQALTCNDLLDPNLVLDDPYIVSANSTPARITFNFDGLVLPLVEYTSPEVCLVMDIVQCDPSNGVLVSLKDPEFAARLSNHDTSLQSDLIKEVKINNIGLISTKLQSRGYSSLANISLELFVTGTNMTPTIVKLYAVAILG